MIPVLPLEHSSWPQPSLRLLTAAPLAQSRERRKSADIPSQRSQIKKVA